MKATTRAVRLGLGLAVLALGLCWARGATNTAAPSARPRALTAAEAKEVAALDRRLSAAVDAGRFEEAARLAGQVVALREKAQGKRHREVVNGRLAVERWERLARVPMQDRPAVVTALRRWAEAQRLQAQRDYTGAERGYGRRRSSIARCWAKTIPAPP
jgi:hypothetical protein